METTAKIQLSPEEMELVKNKEWILTKHIITKKVFEMFGDLNEMIKKEAEPFNYLFPDNIKYQNGKISKGENYQLLPYIILDYPSFFWKDRVFAIRTMFWWGNFFSVTLHLSGTHKQKYIPASEDLFLFLQEKNFFICINEDEWQHHFREDNYIPASSVSFEKFKKINEKDFFKISKMISLDQWKNVNDFVINSIRDILQLLQVSFLNDGTGL